MYESYQTIKYFHVFTVILSLSMFSIRGCMMLLARGNYKHRVWRLITAFNDSLLLVLGGYLAYINSGLWQFIWFQTKMAFLVLYITFGILAINRLENHIGRRLSLFLAIICAMHMLQLAIYKTTWFLI